MEFTNTNSELDQTFFISLESLRLLLDDSENVIYRYNYLLNEYDLISPSILKLTGYNAAEINQFGFSKLVKKTIRTETEINYDNENNLKDFIAKYLIETKDGSLKWIEDISFFNTDKEETRFSVGVLRDITPLQNYLTKLNEDKNNLDSILDLADIIFILTDDNDYIRMINKYGCLILGYEKNGIVDKKFSDYFTPAANHIQKNNYKRLDSYTIEVTAQTKSGKNKLISLQRKELKDINGNIIYTINSGIDVTEKRKDEKIQELISEILEVANSEKNLDEFFKLIHSSVSQLMPAENFYIALYEQENNLITFPYFIDKVDKSAPPKRFGKGLTEYILNTGKSALIDKKKDEELVNSGEVELLGSTTEIWLGVPLKIQNKIIGVLVLQDYDHKETYGEREKEILELIAYPISRAIERKRVEQERGELIEKLQELNASKDKLFSLISHDLRSPFNSLLGFSEILTTEYESLTHEEIKEYLNVIYETSKNLFGMTNNLLQFSRFQMNRIEFAPVKLNLRKIIEINLNMLKGNAIRKQINIFSDVDPKIEVFADEEMLNSIIQNLLSNGIKFTNKEGEIKITAKIKDFFNHADQVEISVQDSGIGISKQNIEKMFKERMQSTPGTEREYGTGVGLLLVKEFIERNGGTIKVQSKLYQGTTFIFTLPVFKN